MKKKNAYAVIDYIDLIPSDYTEYKMFFEKNVLGGRMLSTDKMISLSVLDYTHECSYR